MRGAPVVPLSGLAGDGHRPADEGGARRSTRSGTAASRPRKLNHWLGEALERHPPPAVSGRRIKIRYMTQVKARPPHFAIFGNQLDALPKSYRATWSTACAKPSTCRACRSAWRCAAEQEPVCRQGRQDARSVASKPDGPAKSVKKKIASRKSGVGWTRLAAERKAGKAPRGKPAGPASFGEWRAAEPRAVARRQAGRFGGSRSAHHADGTGHHPDRQTGSCGVSTFVLREIEDLARLGP